MLNTDLDKTYSIEEYFAIEEQSEIRYEFFYGNLYEMPGASFLHNQICMLLWMIFRKQLADDQFSIGIESVKIKIQGEDVFLYPDVFVSKFIENPGETYFITDPIFIAEVLSDTTRRNDSTDKFIQYRKIDSLQYYLLVEPEKQVVIFYEKMADGNWVGKTYTEKEEAVILPALNAIIRIGDLYGK